MVITRISYFRKCIPVICMVLLCLSACNNTSGLPEETDSHTSLVVKETEDKITCRLPDGNVSIIPKHPERTIILLTSLLDLWVETGGSVIARCSGDLNVPDEARDAETVGSFNNPNLEKIIALQPDLVISSDVGNFRAVIPILEQNNIPYAYFNYVNYYDYVHISELFSRLNGTEERFQKSYHKMREEVDHIVSRCSKYPSPTVLIVFATSNSVSCELPNSQTGVMLAMLGAQNIIPSKYYMKGKTRIDFSLERIVQMEPDIILLNTMGDVDDCRERLRKEFETNAAWSTLRAIRKGRFYVLPKKYFLYKPNDAFPDALRYLAGILYEGFKTDSQGLSKANASDKALGN